jgi:hypothetical protein
MHFGDAGNAFFETVGGVLQVRNTIQIVKDKQVKGVYWPAWLFFTLWGYWNIWYYPSLNQWLSFSGGLLIAASNTVWVALAWKYSRNSGGKKSAN